MNTEIFKTLNVVSKAFRSTRHIFSSLGMTYPWLFSVSMSAKHFTKNRLQNISFNWVFLKEFVYVATAYMYAFVVI